MTWSKIKLTEKTNFSFSNFSYPKDKTSFFSNFTKTFFFFIKKVRNGKRSAAKLQQYFHN